MKSTASSPGGRDTAAVSGDSSMVYLDLFGEVFFMGAFLLLEAFLGEFFAPDFLADADMALDLYFFARSSTCSRVRRSNASKLASRRSSQAPQLRSQKTTSASPLGFRVR